MFTITVALVIRLKTQLTAVHRPENENHNSESISIHFCRMMNNECHNSPNPALLTSLIDDRSALEFSSSLFLPMKEEGA